MDKIPFKFIANSLENIKEGKIILNRSIDTSPYSSNSFRAVGLNISDSGQAFINNNSSIKDGQIYQGSVINANDKEFEEHFGAFAIKGDGKEIFNKGDNIELLVKREDNNQLSLKLLINRNSQNVRLPLT